MRYCSLPDLQLAIPPQTLIWLSNDDESATAMNAAVVEEAVRNPSNTRANGSGISS